MDECTICLDVLRNPVSVPCGHIHCEKCLRNHITSGADALTSTCPTCREPFSIAKPDFAFVPKKYHDFILPSVRKIYVDIPSITALENEVGDLTRRLDASNEENQGLRQRCDDYQASVEKLEAMRQTLIKQEEAARRDADQLRRKCGFLSKENGNLLRDCEDYEESIGELETVRRTLLEREEAARQEVDKLRGRCDSLEKKSQETEPRNDVNTGSSSARFWDIVEALTNEEENHAPPPDPGPPRPKRALPRSRSSNSLRNKDEQQLKRQRTLRRSDVGSSS